MNAAGLVKQIDLNRKEREKVFFEHAETIYNQVVKDMLYKEVTSHTIELGEVINLPSDIYLNDKLGLIDYVSFVRKYLAPKFNQNGFLVKDIDNGIDISVDLTKCILPQ